MPVDRASRSLHTEHKQRVHKAYVTNQPDRRLGMRDERIKMALKCLVKSANLVPFFPQPKKLVNPGPSSLTVAEWH